MEKTYFMKTIMVFKILKNKNCIYVFSVDFKHIMMNKYQNYVYFAIKRLIKEIYNIYLKIACSAQNI